MNWNLLWTMVGIGVAGLFIVPFYLAMFLAFERSRNKMNLELFITANHMDKKIKFDEQIERLFEDGVTE